MKILKRANFLTRSEVTLWEKIVRWASAAGRYDQIKIVRVHHAPRRDEEGNLVLCRPIMTRQLDNGRVELWVNLANLYHPSQTGLQLTLGLIKRHLNSDLMTQAETMARGTRRAVAKTLTMIRARNRSENPDQLTSRRVRSTIDLIRSLPERWMKAELKRRAWASKAGPTVTVRMGKPKTYSLSEAERRDQARATKWMNAVLDGRWAWSERGVKVTS